MGRKRALNAPPQPSGYYVYTLAYPDGTVFYVGKGTGNRAQSHIIEAEQWVCQCRKCHVIQSIIFKGKKVKISYVFTSEDAQPSLQKEAELIRLLSQQGTLVNVTYVKQEPIYPPTPLHQMSIPEYTAWVRRNLRDPKEQSKAIREHIKNRVRGLRDSISSHRSMPKDLKAEIMQEISELKQLIGDGWQRSFDLIEDGPDFDWTDIK